MQPDDFDFRLGPWLLPLVFANLQNFVLIDVFAAVLNMLPVPTAAGLA